MPVVLKTQICRLLALSLWCAASENLWSQAFLFRTLAGNAGYGSADGPTNQARFNFPQGVAADNSGNVYVADTQNSTIRKIDPSGNVSTLAGLAGYSGTANGTGAVARFSFPQGIAVDASTNIYVADTGNSIIRRITSSGVVSTIAGTPGFIGSSNGLNSAALFNLPGALAVDAAGVLYVADTHNSAIRKLTPSGTNWLVTTLAGAANINTNLDGTNTGARFYWPSGIAVDTNRNLYVADTGNNRIRKITPVGTNWVTTTLLPVGVPAGIAVDLVGNLFVSAPGDNTIRRITAMGSNWVQSTLAGISGVAGSADGSTNDALFNEPLGLAVLTNGVMYVADSLNNTIRQVTPTAIVSTLAGAAGGPGSVDGDASQARFSGPLGIAVDGATNVYVADTQNNCIRQITPAGVVTTLAGMPTNPPGSMDGIGTNASFNHPAAVAVDANDNLYVADSSNNEIRKLVPTGTNWMVTTLAGRAGAAFYGPITNVVGNTTNISVVLASTAFFTNYSGLITNVVGNATNVSVIITNVPIVTNSIGGGNEIIHLATNTFALPNAPPKVDGIGTNALFYRPSGLALDNLGNLYVADGGTNGVRLISPAASVTTIAGSVGAYVVDTNLFGTNPLAFHSSAVVVDNAGTVYVSDTANNTIRKITAIGAVTTIAGSPGLYGVADGTNAAARFASPVSLALDLRSNLYVADAVSHTIRKVTVPGADWVVTTVGGQPNAAGSEDGPSNKARFNGASGIAADSSGNLYVADTGNNTIRFGQVVPPGSVTLQISSSLNQIVISWPASAAGFSLEVNSNLAAGGSWLPVTNLPAISGANLVVTNQATAAAAFYRLRQP